MEGLFHRFNKDISRIELPGSFNNPFFYTAHQLCVAAAEELRSMVDAADELRADTSTGKMLGVLVVRDKAGEVGFLAGFSGLLCGSNRVAGFVPPVFDFLAPGSYFKREEAGISAINDEIKCIKGSDEYVAALSLVAVATTAANKEIAERRALNAVAKQKRAERRAAGALSPAEEADMIKCSQFEKAELKRVTKRCNAAVDAAKEVLRVFEERLATLAARRKTRSAALQEWLFANFKILNARGEERSLLSVFAEYTGGLPPAGAGECAAPKMLQYAYAYGLQPLAMAEFWMGASPVGEVRRDGCFYPACKSKCLPILTYMLQGLDVEETALERGGANIDDIKILYIDDSLIVVDKPSGVLSVPGIVGGDSVQEWLRAKYGSNDIFVVHRLDMATSGILVAARSMEVLKAMQALFAGRAVEKEYVAMLDGVPAVNNGEIALPLAADYDNRPCQKVDYLNGKSARTIYRLLRKVDWQGSECALVSLVPVTGRTHQLRVHCAHHAGLDVPIVGDTLYGRPADRLMLHACRVAFVHPVSGERVELYSPAEWCLG